MPFFPFMPKNFKKIVFITLTTTFLFLLAFNLVFNFSEKNLQQEEVFSLIKEGIHKPVAEENNNFTEQELAHLEDVKSLIQKVNLFFYLLLPILTLLFIQLRKKKKEEKEGKEEVRGICHSIGKITIIFAAALRFFTLFFFEKTFVAFHLIFFPQGNWMFPAESKLIQTFPLEFFVSFTKNFLLITLLLGSLFILLPIFWRYARKKF